MNKLQQAALYAEDQARRALVERIKGYTGIYTITWYEFTTPQLVQLVELFLNEPYKGE